MNRVFSRPSGSGFEFCYMRGAAFEVVPLWVCDALDEGEEYGEEGEGEAAADVGMEVGLSTFQTQKVHLLPKKHGFNKVKTRADKKNSRSSLKTGDSAVKPKLSVIRKMKCEAEDIFGADLS